MAASRIKWENSDAEGSSIVAAVDWGSATPATDLVESTAQALAMRARIVLLAAEGLSNTAVAQQVSAMLQTIGKWQRRFLEGGIDSLLEPRPGSSRMLGDEDIERVLALTLESKPADATHWSTRSMAARTGFRSKTACTGDSTSS